MHGMKHAYRFIVLCFILVTMVLYKCKLNIYFSLASLALGQFLLSGATRNVKNEIDECQI